jgi:hypothetical protein
MILITEYTTRDWWVWDFVLRMVSQRTRTFRELNLFPSSGKRVGGTCSAFLVFLGCLALKTKRSGNCEYFSPLWREDGSVVYNCSWPLSVQTFSGPAPMGLVTIIYCLRFETSLFVASYDSQSYGGGIRPRLHTGAATACLIWHGLLL